MRFNASHLIALVAIGAIPSSALPLDRSSTGLAARDSLAPELANQDAFAVAKRAEQGALYPLPPPPGKSTADLAKEHKEKQKPGYMKDTDSSRRKQQPKPGKKSPPPKRKGKRSTDEAADEEAFASS